MNGREISRNIFAEVLRITEEISINESLAITIGETHIAPAYLRPFMNQILRMVAIMLRACFSHN